MVVQSTHLFSLLTIKAGLALECKGLKHSSVSRYSIAKEILGITGRPSKQSVLEEFTAYVESIKGMNDENN